MRKVSRLFDISILAPHTGRDVVLLYRIILLSSFQSSRPIRGATFAFAYVVNTDNAISILAPHTGRDSSIRAGDSGPGYFNPRAPYGARPPAGVRPRYYRNYFNPRAPYGARPARATTAIQGYTISILAPHTGRDSCFDLLFDIINISILAPHTGRDFSKHQQASCVVISILAPHTGRDLPLLILSILTMLFQSSRPIRGATDTGVGREGGGLLFQSSRPIRGATMASTAHIPSRTFQSSRPIRGATAVSRLMVLFHVFQSSRPIRGATKRRQILQPERF